MFLNSRTLILFISVAAPSKWSMVPLVLSTCVMHWTPGSWSESWRAPSAWQLPPPSNTSALQVGDMQTHSYTLLHRHQKACRWRSRAKIKHLSLGGKKSLIELGLSGPILTCLNSSSCNVKMTLSPFWRSCCGSSSHWGWSQGVHGARHDEGSHPAGYSLRQGKRSEPMNPIQHNLGYIVILPRWFLWLASFQVLTECPLSETSLLCLMCVTFPLPRLYQERWNMQQVSD